MSAFAQKAIKVCTYAALLAAVFIVSFVAVRERNGTAGLQEDGNLLGYNVFADAPPTEQERLCEEAKQAGRWISLGDGGDDSMCGGDDGDDGGGL